MINRFFYIKIISQIPGSWISFEIYILRKMHPITRNGIGYIHVYKKIDIPGKSEVHSMMQGDVAMYISTGCRCTRQFG